MHAYHDGLAGYSAAQILHDGCEECEARGADVGNALSKMDPHNFRRAWGRAAEFGRFGALDIARAERPLLDALWAVQIHLQRAGWPVGVIPADGVYLARQ